MKMNISQIIEIIYLDKAGRITQRKIEVRRIRATCLSTRQPRVFLAANILSWRPVPERQYA